MDSEPIDEKTVIGELVIPLIMQVREGKKIRNIIFPAGVIVEVSTDRQYPHSTTEEDIDHCIELIEILKENYK